MMGKLKLPMQMRPEWEKHRMEKQRRYNGEKRSEYKEEKGTVFTHFIQYRVTKFPIREQRMRVITLLHKAIEGLLFRNNPESTEPSKRFQRK